MLAKQRLDDNPCRPRHFRPAPCAPIDPGGPATRALETCRTRLLFTGAMFTLVFAVIGLRLFGIMAFAGDPDEAHAARAPAIAAAPLARADIVDRNGVLLATTLSAPSLYVDPKIVRDAKVDVDAATQALAAALPGVPAAEIHADLTSAKGFVWVKRLLTPVEQNAVNRIGIPGLDFRRQELRFYPLNDLTSHVVGYCGIDGTGLAGIEQDLDPTLKGRQEPVALSIDTRVQFILRDELRRVVEDFTAQGAGGIIMNARTGEIVAMVSLPDFDPNHPAAIPPGETPDQAKQRRFDKMSFGDYELGSVFKIFNTAMALDSGVSTMTSTYDAIHPIHIGRFTITDYHGKHRMLSVPEIFMYSSNLGSARMAVSAGADRQRAFLARLGLLVRPTVELDDVAQPHFPKDWREVNVMTIAFGHGISVSPLAAVAAAAAIVNGGMLHQATLLKIPPGTAPQGTRVISQKTSDQMRKLMRLVVEHGTASLGAAPGYVVGGKTGTAEKNLDGHYFEKRLVSTFIAAFPMNDPQYVILTLVDEPHGNKESHGYATAGWTVVPATSRIIERIAPLLGVPPVDENAPELVHALTVDSLQGKRIEAY